METDAVRRGRWILLGVVAVVVFLEAGLGGLQLAAGRYRWASLGRLVLTLWLLWQVWEGAAWARWVMAVLLGLGAAGAVTLAAADGRPAVVLAAGAVAAVCGTLAGALGLSPSVRAFQAAQRTTRA